MYYVYWQHCKKNWVSLKKIQLPDQRSLLIRLHSQSLFKFSVKPIFIIKTNHHVLLWRYLRWNACFYVWPVWFFPAGAWREAKWVVCQWKMALKQVDSKRKTGWLRERGNFFSSPNPVSLIYMLHFFKPIRHNLNI